MNILGCINRPSLLASFPSALYSLFAICAVRGGSRGSVWGGAKSRGSGGRAPSGVQGRSPWSGGQGGEAPLKLTIFWQFIHKFFTYNKIKLGQI